MNTFFQKAAANPPEELGRPIATRSQFPELVNKNRHPQVISIILNSKTNLKKSKDDAIQKAINCYNFELFLFSVPQEKIDNVKPDSLATRGKMREGKPKKSSSATTIDQLGLSSAGNVHHPQRQPELKSFE